MDVHTKIQRSYNMSRIRGKNTKPEIIVRKLLWQRGYRYRLHKKELPGKPDIVFAGRKKAIFIHGCFWHMHKCEYFKWPETHKEFWKKKIGDTVARDNRLYEKMSNMGWKYIIIWECETKAKNMDALWLKIESFLNSK